MTAVTLSGIFFGFLCKQLLVVSANHIVSVYRIVSYCQFSKGKEGTNTMVRWLQKVGLIYLSRADTESLTDHKFKDNTHPLITTSSFEISISNVVEATLLKTLILLLQRLAKIINQKKCIFTNPKMENRHFKIIPSSNISVYKFHFQAKCSVNTVGFQKISPSKRNISATQKHGRTIVYDTLLKTLHIV